MGAKSATVKVRLVVEVSANGSWGEDCTMGQIRKQGTESAMGALGRVLSDANEHNPRFRIVSVEACDMVVPLEAKP